MIVRKKQSKKRIIIYLASIVVLAAVNIYIYLANSDSDRLRLEANFDSGTMLTPGQDAGGLGLDQGQIVKKDKNKMPDSPLEYYLFFELKKVGDWPIVPKNIGKSNPFAPFFSD